MQAKDVIKLNEAQIQKTFFDWIRLYPEFDRYMFHIPNGGSRHIIEAKNLKALGVKPGVSDVFGAKPSKGYAGLWMEFKNSTGKLTQAQTGFLIAMEEVGYKTCVPRSFEEAQQYWLDYIE